MPKPKPGADRLQNAWDLLSGLPSDEEIEAEVVRIDALDAQGRARELEEAGFSRREVAASARHMRERLAAGEDSSESFGPARKRRRGEEPESLQAPFHAVQAVPVIAPEAPRHEQRWLVRFAAVFLGAAVCVLIALEITTHRPKEPVIAQPFPSSSASPPSPEPTASATPAGELRERAALACRASSWSECRDLLDRAAGIDPRGDRDPEVVRLRRQMPDALAPSLGLKPHLQ